MSQLSLLVPWHEQCHAAPSCALSSGFCFLSGSQALDSLATSEFSYKLIMVHIPHPVKLMVITNKQKRLLFCCSQVYHQCVASTCSSTHYMTAVKAQSKSPMTIVNAADKMLLVRLGALSCKANHASLISVSVACKALTACSTDAIIVSAFDDIRTQPHALTVLPLPDHVLQPCAQPSIKPASLKLLGPLPATLPPYQLPHDMKARYGLITTKPHLAKLFPLSQQLDDLKTWCMNVIQLDRQAQAHGSRTWGNTLDQVQLFLGICFHNHQIMQPTLQLYLSPHLIGNYVSYRMACQQSSLTIKSCLATAGVVMKWWQTKLGGHDPSLAQGLQWIQRLQVTFEYVCEWAVMNCHVCIGLQI